MAGDAKWFFMILRLVFSVALLAGSPALLAQDWPEFRGPNQNGVSDAKNTPTSWSETENVAWKTSLPGKGWSSPIVSGGKIWLTTAVETQPTEEERQQLLAEFDPNKAKQRQAVTRIELRAIQVNLDSGKIERNILLTKIETPGAIHSLNSYASPTPVIDNGLLYCDFGTFGTMAVDTVGGEILWERRFEIIHNVGPGSSPIVVDDLVILVRDGVDVQYVLALDKKTGETVWKTNRPPMRAPNGAQHKAYSTPILIDSKGAQQLVIPTSQWIAGYEPSTGREIWRADHGKGFSLVPRPVYGHGLVYFCTGFGKPQLWAIRPDGTGDVTESHVEWKELKRISKKPSPLLVGDYLYVLEDDGGVLSCLDALTGEGVWQERLGGNFSASPMFADDKIYLCNQEGQTSVVAPGDEFRTIAVNEIDGEIMASPAPLNGGLLIRSDSALYRINEKK